MSNAIPPTILSEQEIQELGDRLKASGWDLRGAAALALGIEVAPLHLQRRLYETVMRLLAPTASA